MYKAKVNFSGVISMDVGEVQDIADIAIAKDLLKAGYIEEVKPADTSKVKSNKKPTKARAKRGNPKGG